MPPTAATATVNLVATGDAAVIASLNKVEKAGGGINRQLGSASRTAANFGASMAQAGTLTATSLGGIASQIADVAFGFGPTGPIVGAIATTTIAIGTLFFKAAAEMEKFRRDIRKLAFDASFTGLQARYDDLQFDIGEAQNEIAALKGIESLGGANAVLARAQRVKAEFDLNQLLERRAYLVPKLQEAAVKTGERQEIALRFQREATAQAEREAAAQKAAADAIKRKADNAREMDAASKALAKASEGITLSGPAVDLGLNATERAPTIPVQVAPRIPIDEASAQLRLDMEALAPMIAANAEQTLGQGIVDGFTAAFQGKNPVKAFANTVLRGMGSMFIEIGKTLLGFGKIMAALQKFLTNIFTAGPAAIIAGAALIALGAAFTGIASGSGGGGGMGGFSSGVGNISNPANVTNVTLSSGSPTRQASQVQPLQQNVFNVFGPGDPMAQRAIIEAYDLGKRRGL